MILYHYTIADRLIKILISKHLKLTPGIDTTLFEDEARVVWLTTNPTWDRTAFYGQPDDAIEAAGKVRISIDSSKVRISHAVSVKQYLGFFEQLVQSAKSVGVDFLDWYVSFEKVPISAFTKIEFYLNKEWVELDMLNI